MLQMHCLEQEEESTTKDVQHMLHLLKVACRGIRSMRNSWLILIGVIATPALLRISSISHSSFRSVNVSSYSHALIRKGGLE